MTYEAPEILELGSVEERTFGGVLVPSRFDFHTGYTGHRPTYPVSGASQDPRPGDERARG